MGATVGDWYQTLTNGFGIDSAGDPSSGYNILNEGWWDFDVTPAERTTLRNLLLFDDNLVMLSTAQVNSGVFGYRVGQNLVSKSDFIEYIGNDSPPSDPSPPGAPSSAPRWVTSGWSYIEDLFDGGSYDSNWNSDFTGNWSLSKMPSSGDDYGSVKGSDGFNIVLNSLAITGDFDLISEVRLGNDNLGTNKDVYMRLRDSGSTEFAKIGWNNGTLEWHATDNAGSNYQLRNSTSIAHSSYGSIFVRIVRSSGTMTAYYKENWEDSWTAFAYTNTYVPTVEYIDVDGASDHGIGMFRFQESGSDFPYS